MKSNKAFTLVELMIVVTIIGLLAAVGTPKFVSMVRKAKEAVSKNNLGVLRSVVSVYYADHTGIWPYQNTAVTGDDNDLLGAGLLAGESLTANAIVPKYVSEIPLLKTGLDVPNEETNSVVVAVNGVTFDYDSRSCHDTAAWVYIKDLGTWYVNCDELDTKGEGIHSW